MRLLVTGSAGLVGSEVAARASHHEVLPLTRAELDIVDRDAVEQAVGSMAPDAVINCAGWTEVDACESDPERAVKVNALGVRHLAVACARAGAHLVHVSTDYVFPGDKSGPYDEWDTPGPRSVYGHSKLGGEIECARHAASWTVARTSWVFGPGGRNFVDGIVGRAAAGEALRVVTDQRGSPTYAPDLAGTLVRLAVERRCGIYHVTNQGACTWHELASAAVELAGLDPSVVGEATTADFPRPAPRPGNSVLAGVALAGSGIPLLRPWRDALAEHLAGAGNSA
ncbi:MAG: dTDP-4-dehydrorhamnose reductase [Acidimicrobiia bacterium]